MTIPTPRPHRRSVPLGVAALTLSAVGLAACGQRAPAKLDRPMIDALAAAGAKAAASRDVAAACALFADDARIRLVEVGFSGSTVQDLEKSQYCTFLGATFAALPPQVSISNSYTLHSVDITSDGQSAEVSAEVVTEIALGGQAMRQTSRQTSTVVLAPGGQARYTRVSARVVAP